MNISGAKRYSVKDVVFNTDFSRGLLQTLSIAWKWEGKCLGIYEILKYLQYEKLIIN